MKKMRWGIWCSVTNEMNICCSEKERIKKEYEELQVAGLDSFHTSMLTRLVLVRECLEKNKRNDVDIS